MMTAEVIKRCGEAGKRAVQENLYDGDGLCCGLVEDGLRTDFVTNGWENLAVTVRGLWQHPGIRRSQRVCSQ